MINFFSLPRTFSSIALASTLCLSVQLAEAQNSLSRNENTRANNLLKDDFVEPYLSGEYYQNLINDEKTYGSLPDDMREIFARIRFISLSIDDRSASDQVLNALARAYLLYDLEAAALNEARKISVPQWRVRTLIDISDYYAKQEDTERALSVLDEAVEILVTINTSDDDSIEQYYFDIASRYALAKMVNDSISTINLLKGGDIGQIEGFMQVAERIAIGTPTNQLLSTKRTDLKESIRLCKPEEIFLFPKESDDRVLSLLGTLEQQLEHTIPAGVTFFLNKAYDIFLEYSDQQTYEISNRALNTLFQFSQKLVETDQRKKAEDVLRFIRAIFIEGDAASDEVASFNSAAFLNPEELKNSIFDPENWQGVQQITDLSYQEARLEFLRSRLIESFIIMDDANNGMELTRQLNNPVAQSLAYVSAGKANNAKGNEDAATALFNYAQDISDLITDARARDFVLSEVVRGQSQAALYGSAFRNINLIKREDLRFRAIYTMAMQMIRNGHVQRALQLVDYLPPSDARIKILANLAHLRSNMDTNFFENMPSFPTTQALFDRIEEIMRNPAVNGRLYSLDSEPLAVLMAMCANASRRDFFNKEFTDDITIRSNFAKADQEIRDSAVEYVATGGDIYIRAEGFGTIAQIMLEQDYFAEAQIFLDTAWDLAWSVRNVSIAAADTIFLQIVRGKIVSQKIIDAYNVATGMGGTVRGNDEVSRNPITGQITYSERILALMIFSRSAMVAGEYGIALRAIDDIGVGSAKSQAMTNAIRDLITVDQRFDIDNVITENN